MAFVCIHVHLLHAVNLISWIPEGMQVSQLLLKIELKYLGLWLLLPPMQESDNHPFASDDDWD